jgi:hypothetical protein
LERLGERGFGQRANTILALYTFFNAAKNAAQRLSNATRVGYTPGNRSPSASGDSGFLRVAYEINGDMKDGEDRTFGGFVIDVPIDATKDEIMELIHKAADKFIKDYNYQVRAYTADITSIYGD